MPQMGKYGTIVIAVDARRGHIVVGASPNTTNRPVIKRLSDILGNLYVATIEDPGQSTRIESTIFRLL